MNKFVLFLAVLTIMSCTKSGTNNGATDFFTPVPVNITNINLSYPQYSYLSIQGGFYYFPLPAGNRGIILYHATTGTSTGVDYVAFDRTCPVNPTSTCSMVSMDSSGFYLICSQSHVNLLGTAPCSGTGACNSTFDPNLGTQRSGSATRGLKQYNVRVDGNGVLSITN